jgi:hypothetical protein
MMSERVQAVLRAWQQRQGEPFTANTRNGPVRITRLTAHSDDDRPAWIEVWAGGQEETGEPHYRIFNPPLLVGDREDPLGAVAEMIGQFGGAAPVRARVIR